MTALVEKLMPLFVFMNNRKIVFFCSQNMNNKINNAIFAYLNNLIMGQYVDKAGITVCLNKLKDYIDDANSSILKGASFIMSAAGTGTIDAGEEVSFTVSYPSIIAIYPNDGTATLSNIYEISAILNPNIKATYGNSYPIVSDGSALTITNSSSATVRYMSIGYCNKKVY